MRGEEENLPKLRNRPLFWSLRRLRRDADHRLLPACPTSPTDGTVAFVLLWLWLAMVAPADELPLGLARLDPEEPPPPAAEVRLGKELFFDKRLSVDGSVSCATCHVPAEAFAQRGRPVSEGVGGKLGRRNSPSLLNVTFAKHLFLDGRSDSLEDQAWQPILAADEMGNHTVEEVLDRLAGIASYATLFRDASGTEVPDKAAVATALASYQRTLLSGNSPFDQWYWGGEKEAINPLAIEGFNLFSGQALCWQCHSVGGDHGITFTDQQFHNTGVEWLSRKKRRTSRPRNPDQSARADDDGRFEASGKTRRPRSTTRPPRCATSQSRHHTCTMDHSRRSRRSSTSTTGAVATAHPAALPE